MGRNLRERLQRIRASAPVKAAVRESPGPPLPHQSPSIKRLDPSWLSPGFNTLKRSVFPNMTLPGSLSFPRTLGILIPDLIPYVSALGSLEPQDLLFFDLETTGLSGGAGTVAFLAAFGRFTGKEVSDNTVRDDAVMEGPLRLRVDQYLLLDYSGEYDFLEALLGEFKGAGVPEGRTGKAPLVVSYNGKSFDAQILKSRCIMNGIIPPVYYHADLLHPSRRLWKRALPSCSQGEIETAVLGLDRTGDIPGALAPEIWFSFLRTGDFASLGGICDHNIRDISGLAHLFLALGDIARKPPEAAGGYRVDPESLALGWRKAIRRNPPGLFGEEAERTGAELLAVAAAGGCPRAAYVMGLDLLREGRHEAGRRYLLEAAGDHNPEMIRAAAYRALAVDAEWRLRDSGEALRLVEAALELGEIRDMMKAELSGRRERLLKKTGKPGTIL